jgi:hypothetical protein
MRFRAVEIRRCGLDLDRLGFDTGGVRISRTAALIVRRQPQPIPVALNHLLCAPHQLADLPVVQTLGVQRFAGRTLPSAPLTLGATVNSCACKSWCSSRLAVLAAHLGGGIQLAGGCKLRIEASRGRSVVGLRLPQGPPRASGPRPLRLLPQGVLGRFGRHPVGGGTTTRRPRDGSQADGRDGSRTSAGRPGPSKLWARP